MVDHQGDVNQLVDDAKRVIGYSTRTGRLQNNGLIEATYAVQDVLDAGGEVASKDIQALAIELNAAIAAIYPVTLIDLGSPWKPFGKEGQLRFARVAFALVAATLIVMTAYYTNLYIQETDVISGLTAIENKEPLDKADRLFTVYKKNPHVLPNGQAANPAANDVANDFYDESYLRLYEELSPIDDKLSTYTQMALALNEQISRVPGWDFITGLLRANSAQSTNSPQGDPQEQIYKRENPNKPYPQLTADAVGADPGNAVAAGPPPAGSVAGLTKADIAKRSATLTTFLITEGLPDVATEVSQNATAKLSHIEWLLSKSREAVELFGVFILPSLYGMIGTIVFELRRLLNPLSPSASIERIIVRTALGGLAGLSITFVFRPFHSSADDATFSGIAIFGVAFLLGFSIDVFFALLDRLVNLIAQSISGVARA